MNPRLWNHREKVNFIHEILVSVAINLQEIDNLHSKAPPGIVIDVVNAAEASVTNLTDECVGAVADAGLEFTGGRSLLVLFRNLNQPDLLICYLPDLGRDKSLPQGVPFCLCLHLRHFVIFHLEVETSVSCLTSLQ